MDDKKKKKKARRNFRRRSLVALEKGVSEALLRKLQREEKLGRYWLGSLAMVDVDQVDALVAASGE